VLIGLVCPYDLSRPGGVQQLCRELKGRIDLAGHSAILVGPGRGAGFISVGNAVGFRANRSVVPLSLDPRAMAATRESLDGVDVVHVHEPLIPLVGWAALGRRDVPTVATFHADPPTWARRAYRLGHTLLGPRLQRCELTAASEVAASALPAEWGRVTIIPNAIHTSDYARAVSRHPQRVVFLGRDERRKGLDVLLEAWPLVRSIQPAAELVVIGADRAHGAPGVHFRGTVDEDTKREVLASGTVFVAPNLGGESFGIVVAEAMAAGCAVVASDLAAFRQVLDGSGLLVTPGDPAALAEAVGRLLSDPELASAMGEAGRERAVRYDWSSVARSYIELYESVVAAH
jgi:phosphatidylinositol alpha-mannosyltransferase